MLTPVHFMDLNSSHTASPSALGRHESIQGNTNLKLSIMTGVGIKTPLSSKD
jgi:hypothetical protein